MISDLSLAILAITLAAAVQPGWAQGDVNSDGQRYVKYFLDHPPASTELTRIPPSARAVTIARVRVTERPFYTGGRHGEGTRPGDPVLVTRIRIVDILFGQNTTSGTENPTYFGIRGSNEQYIYPRTPSQLASEYFVISFVDSDDVGKLLGFLASREEYETWERDVRSYEIFQSPR
jgi:hypothetical protein